MTGVATLAEFKELVQATLENNEVSLHAFGKTLKTQLKAYLIESNVPSPANLPVPRGGTWAQIDPAGWYVARGQAARDSLFLDTTSGRVWKLYSLLEANESDAVADDWVEDTKGLDHAWLSRGQLLMSEVGGSWEQRGLGLRFDDGLFPEEERGSFSLKAWHGVGRYFERLGEVLNAAKEQFAIHSARWQKRSNGAVVISTEWYSNGKATINRGVDVDEVLAHVSHMAHRYADGLSEATDLRDSQLGAFEFDFAQAIDLDRLSEAVAQGTGGLKLWLVETEKDPALRRFKGVDLHTWDRVLLDVGPNFAYLSIPQEGCVNAVPRMAVAQGEANSGKTEVFYDGVPLFT